MRYRNPGFYRDYPSKWVSKYYCWSLDIGYPELDIVEFWDGSWALRQYLRSPYVPSVTPWSWVLQNITHLEKTPIVVQKYAEQLDLERKWIWDEQDAKEKQMIRDAEYEEWRAEARAEQFMKGVRGNDALMQRIAKKGLGELHPLKILNHCDRHRLGKGYKEVR